MATAVRTQKELDEALARGDGYIDLVGDGVFAVAATGSSHVTATSSSQVRAYDSSQVRATGSVAVTCHEDADGNGPTVTGGVLISVRRATTGREWADFYGIPVDDAGIAVLYKAVEADWRGSHKHPGISYKPGQTPVAHDWDPTGECGGGLHLVPRPPMGDQYLNVWPAAHYVGCPVRIDDVVLLDDKVKVRRLAPPCFEVDIDGEPVAAASEEGAA